jgi:hypothetical protein
LKLVHGARRQAYEAVGADRSPCVREGSILLADMDAVGVHSSDEVGPVVQHEERAMNVADPPERLCRPDELIIAYFLVAKLHDIDPAAECGVQ